MFCNFHSRLSLLLKSIFHEENKVANSSQLYQAKKDDWCFKGVLANSQNYFSEESAFNIIYNLDIELSKPHQFIAKVSPIRKGYSDGVAEGTP